jgi:hypothetical protein
MVSTDADNLAVVAVERVVHAAAHRLHVVLLDLVEDAERVGARKPGVELLDIGGRQHGESSMSCKFPYFQRAKCGDVSMRARRLFFDAGSGA